MDRLIALFEEMNFVGRAQMLRAVRAGVLNVVIHLDPDGQLPLASVRKSAAPVLVVIGDAEDDTAVGPAGWVCISHLLDWANAALVLAIDDARPYVAAIGLTLAYRRFALVVTDAVHAGEWDTVLLARHLPCVTLTPSNCGSHQLFDSVDRMRRLPGAVTGPDAAKQTRGRGASRTRAIFCLP